MSRVASASPTARRNRATIPFKGRPVDLKDDDMTIQRSFETIVIGLGAIGSATAYHLAKRGSRVLGIEMFHPAHDQGSSHGYHRLIRTSSLADDGYVPLAERSFALWRDLEGESAAPLLEMAGEVWLFDAEQQPAMAGLADRTIAGGFRKELTARDLAARFPGFRLHDGMGPRSKRRRGTCAAKPGFSLIWRRRSGTGRLFTSMKR